jgi:outer membrane protein OmpA-like peptidoglycan-associated protein
MCCNIIDIQKGITQKQLIAKGYGKEQLLQNDAAIAQLKTEIAKETAHQENRRTEIKILEE